MNINNTTDSKLETALKEKPLLSLLCIPATYAMYFILALFFSFCWNHCPIQELTHVNMTLGNAYILILALDFIHGRFRSLPNSVAEYTFDKDNGDAHKLLLSEISVIITLIIMFTVSLIALNYAWNVTIPNLFNVDLPKMGYMETIALGIIKNCIFNFYVSKPNRNKRN
jgi:hypothetical protein